MLVAFLFVGTPPQLAVFVYFTLYSFSILIIVIVKINAIISPPFIHKLMTIGCIIPDTLTTSTFGGCVPGKMNVDTLNAHIYRD